MAPCLLKNEYRIVVIGVAMSSSNINTFRTIFACFLLLPILFNQDIYIYMLSSFVFLDFFCAMSSTTSKTISYETAVAIVTSRIPPRYSRRQYQRWVLAEHYCPISDADFDCLVELGLMEKIVALFGETEYNNEWLHQIYDSLYEEENEDEDEDEDEEGAKENREDNQIDDEPVMAQVRTHGSVLNDVSQQTEFLVSLLQHFILH